MSRQGVKQALTNAKNDIKAGVKNVPHMYDALYNQKINKSGGSLGVKKTVTNNVKFITGNVMPRSGETQAQANRRAAPAKATLVGLGAASVTPLGPVVGFIAGVNKSRKDRAAAKANPPTPYQPPAPLRRGMPITNNNNAPPLPTGPKPALKPRPQGKLPTAPGGKAPGGRPPLPTAPKPPLLPKPTGRRS